MQCAIWGAGAVGLGLASALARPGERVRVVVRRPELAEALAREGLRRRGLFGSVDLPPDTLAPIVDPRALVDAPPDWLLVCVKAFASEDVARALAPIADALSPRTALVLCQNGWGNEQPFLDDWPRTSIFHARVITGFHRRDRSAVEVTAHAAPIALGSLFGVEAAPRLAGLALRIAEGGLPAETTEDMRGILWAKMLYNCALNPLGALAGKRYGELAGDATSRALMEAVVHEIFAVLDADGVELAWRDAGAYLETFYADLIPPTAAHESSMLQDLRAGKPTEIEALCGAVETLAAQHGVATPVVSALAQLVRVAERGALAQAEARKPQDGRRRPA